MFPITMGESISNLPEPITPGCIPNTFTVSFSHWFRRATVWQIIKVFCPSFLAMAKAVKVFPQDTEALIIALSSSSL